MSAIKTSIRFEEVGLWKAFTQLTACPFSVQDVLGAERPVQADGPPGGHQDLQEGGAHDSQQEPGAAGGGELV
jgi:hypothetical protein